MKKIFFVLLINLIANNVLAQEDMKPKSFMFSSMANFTDFPTATANGIPDVSLPLFSVATASPDFNLDLKLQYNLHSNINANVTGGQFGSAWNLNIDATIGREVRGINTEVQKGYMLADELYFSKSNENRSNSDIYTYNFFGNTGKFYLKRENGVIIPVIHESNSYVEIKINYNQSLKAFVSIEMIDVAGRKFIFSNPTSVSFNVYYSTAPKGDDDIGYNPPVIAPPEKTGFNSISSDVPPVTGEGPGFYTQTHYGPRFWKNLNLSKIYDRHGNLIAEYEYEDVTKMETTNSFLKKIKINTVGSIEFENSIGSVTQNNFATASWISLKKINGELINKISFDYTFFGQSFENGTQSFGKQLLNRIRVFGKEETSKDITEISYKNFNINTNTAKLSSKGYILKIDACDYGKNFNLSTYGILQKIKFNTGGSVLYDFEPNTHSYLNIELSAYQYGNSDNQILTNYTPNYNALLEEGTFEVSSNIVKIYLGLSGVYNSKYLYPPNGEGIGAKGTEKSPKLMCLNNLAQLNTSGNVGTYRITPYKPNQLSSMVLKGLSFVSEANTNKFFYSSGQRIKRIAYFEGDVSQTLLQNDAAVPTAEREIIFDYSTDGTSKTSSGKIHTREQYNHELLLDSYVLYEKVAVKVRGIGKSEYYFNNVAQNSNSWRFLNKIPKKTLLYNNNNQLIKEQEFERDYKFFNSDLYTGTFDREPIILKEYIKTKEYLNNQVAEFFATTAYDSIHRNVIHTLNQNLQTQEIEEHLYHFNKINKTFVTVSHDIYLNYNLHQNIYSTYDNNANLKYQEIFKDNQPFHKLGNENTNFNSRGNVLEYIQPNGTYVSNIYGHEGTKLVAQLVNVKRSEISQPLLSTIAINSNETGSALIGNPNVFFPTYNETKLISSLNTLRINHPNAFVTTYLYNTLVGVKSITDPNGDTQTFEYDNQNRLNRIKDHQGNTLNRYQYNFKQ